MAIRFRIINTNNNNVLAQHDIPDSNLAKLQELWEEPPQTAAMNALLFAVEALRQETRQRRLIKAESTALVNLQSAQNQVAAARSNEEADFDSEWAQA